MHMSYGAEDAWNAMIFPESHPANTSFLQSTIEAARHLFIDPANSFLARAQQTFDHYNGAAALQFARRVISQMTVVTETPHIVEYTTLSDMQSATVLMQRWIMANPNVRGLYTQQRIDGYSDTYTDTQAGHIGWEHYDYRRVMRGVMQEQDDGSWQAEQYFDELQDGDRELLLDEQMAIIRTWSAMDALIALSKDDPTSPSGGQL